MDMGMEGMGLQHKKRLAQDHIDSLRSALQRLSTTFLPPDAPTDSPTLHAYGAVNVEKTRREVDKSVGELCNILESYKALSAARQEKLLPRYLSLLRDRAQLSAQVEQFKKSLGHSLRMAENHLAKRGSKLTGEGEGGRQQLFVRNLQSVAEAHGLQLYAFDPSEMGMEVATKTLSASISGQHFLVDVHVTLQGHVDKVNVTFTSTAGDPSGEGEQPQFSRPEVDEEITKLLREGDLKRFDEVVRLLNELDVIYTENPTTDLKQALWILEDDLFELHRREREITGGDDGALLRDRHGAPMWQPEGLFLHYHASPRHLLLDKLSGKRLAHTHGALVTLREGRTLVKLPMASHLPGLPPLDDQSLPPGLAIEPIEIALDGGRIHFDLHLRPAVPILTDTLRRMLDLVWGPHPPTDGARHSKDHQPFVSLQTLLCPSAGARFEHHGVSYVYSGQEERGTVVHHIPFTHLKQLLPLLQHLRQQLVFNELFTSCFSDQRSANAAGKGVPAAHGPEAVPQGDDAMDYTFDGGEAPMVEVASAGDSPYALSVTLLDPVTQNLICLQLSVELGGTIRAILHSSLLEKQPFSSSYVAELLNKSHSIPLTIKHLLQGKYGLAKQQQPTQ